jgi:hypothetical protein
MHGCTSCKEKDKEIERLKQIEEERRKQDEERRRQDQEALELARDINRGLRQVAIAEAETSRLLGRR